MRKYLLVLIISGVTAQFSAAQKAGDVFTLQSGYGFVFRHADKMGEASRTHPYFFEASYSRLKNGNREWHKPFRYPEVGISTGFMNFHTSLLGKAIYAFPYMEKSLAENDKTKLNLRIGFGGTYLTKRYDAEDNFQNIAISTHLNYLLRGEFSVNFKLAENWQLRLASTLTHFSNGGFKQPNSGINIFSIGLGMSYLPDFKNFKIVTDTFTHQFKKGFSVNLAGAFTIQEIEYPGGKKYFGGNIISYLNYRLNRKSALNIGSDLFLNSALQHIISERYTTSPPDYKQAGLTIGHELFINRLSLLTQLGYYIYAPYPNQAVIYQRYALKYWLGSRFYTAISLKAHFGTAEYTEWTLGMKIADF
jgi:hypothetical protein